MRLFGRLPWTARVRTTGLVGSIAGCRDLATLEGAAQPRGPLASAEQAGAGHGQGERTARAGQGARLRPVPIAAPGIVALVGLDAQRRPQLLLDRRLDRDAHVLVDQLA